MMKTTMVRTGLTLFVGSVVGMAAACSGGSTLGAADAGSSGTSGTSGTSGSSGTSGTSGSSGTSGACSEFHPGGQNDPGIGGTAQSQVIAQSVADIAGASATQVTDLTAACKKLAVALAASSSDQTAADAQVDPLDKVKSWCALAVKSVGTTKADAGGTLDVARTAMPCKLAAATKATCQTRCASPATCDATANPLRCTGGSLSSGYCVGGKLEGGCAVDAKCDASCDVTVSAGALCDAPTVTSTVTGPANPSAAASLRSALDANLPAILALQAHLDEEAKVSAIVGGVASGISDLKPACIVKVASEAQAAIEAIQAGVTASANVVASVN